MLWEVTLHLEALLYLLTDLGFIINIPKSVTSPTQQIEFLGLQVQSTTLRLSLLGEKLHHIRLEVNLTLQKGQMTVRHLAQVIGKLHAASQAVLLFYRSLQGDLQKVLNSSNQDHTASLTLSSPAGKSYYGARPIKSSMVSSRQSSLS